MTQVDMRRGGWMARGWVLGVTVFVAGLVLGGVGIHAAAQKKTDTARTAVPVAAAKETGAPASSTDAILSDRQNAIVRAARLAGPSVVSVSAVATRVVSTAPIRDPFFDQFFRQFFPDAKQEIPSLGSGFIVDSERGYVITNDHVIHAADRIKVTLTDGREFDAVVVGSDETYDLAVLKINGTNLPHAKLGTSDDLIVGEWAIAIGNPFGFLLTDTQPTVTAGVISAVHRTVKSSGGPGIYKDMVQTDAAINPGNSGGPLVNSLGEVIGINTFIFSQSGGSIGIGFAIPVDRAKRIVEQLVKSGYVPRPWIGVSVEDLSNINPYWLRRLNIKDTNGILVTSVENNSPADKGGVQPGDIIREINRKKITSSEEARQAFFDAEIGSTITFTIQREGDAMQKSLVITEAKHQ